MTVLTEAFPASRTRSPGRAIPRPPQLSCTGRREGGV